MRRSRSARVHLALLVGAAALCLFSLAACEDPSGVGLTVLDPSENDPDARTLDAVTLGFAPLDDVTGSFLTTTGFQTFLALAGFVEDPAYGSMSARAFLDVLPPQNLPDGFRDRPIEQATLRLRRAYAYGDTSMTVGFELRQIAEEWTAATATSDTLFPVMDGVITSFDVTPGDSSLVEISLPDSWITANDTTLRSPGVSTIFHGFEIRAQDGTNAIYGFSGASQLELISEEDTVYYGASELFSNLEPSGPPTPTDGAVVPFQDGTGHVLSLVFDADTLGLSAINTAFVRVNADTTAFDTPAGFVRPLARRLGLYAFTEDAETPTLVTIADLDEERQTFTFRSAVLTNIFQEIVLDRSVVDSFAVGFPPSRSSLDTAPLVGFGHEGAPRAVVVLIPSND